MTDITELSQREKFEAWWERTQHNGNPPRFGWECWRDGEGYKVDDDESELDGMWEAWKAAGAEMVEALEKAQQVDEELCRLLPPGVEYMDPPDGGDVTPLEGVRRMVADYRQRIDELESRTVKLPHKNLGHPKLFLLCPFPYYDAEDMEKALAAAGIKVEAE
ncbi:hypothetical protein [Klebsiella pneumoniae]|uniref:hypothetical protein n=1 Tax=Klebsiella pneumoniae TaxID=573 RepID=UPI0025A13489|nr:hypothetical protein [Klebsiella pneumoniae]MDM7389896.1 hypothetical protein [Klebsiella pneumoniae]